MALTLDQDFGEPPLPPVPEAESPSLLLTSLSNFLLLLKGRLCRIPVAICSSLLLPQMKEVRWRGVQGPAEGE